MTAYEPGDDATVVTRGVLTLTLDTALDDEDAYNAAHLLHPEVRLAHREWLNDDARSGTARVQWMVPGVMRDRDEATWRESVPAMLGLLEEAAHTEAIGDHENDPATRGNFSYRVAPLAIPALADACARWTPPRTLALVTDANSLVTTDQGLWFTRVFAPLSSVPLGYNLGAYLATVFPTSAEALGDDVLVPALTSYWAAVDHALNARPPAKYCVCGRAPAEHEPTLEQLRRYAAIAAGAYAPVIAEL
ncbi:hypothetical protein [Embleya sp. MST-111070]|uniref:hypothetical protein n=1 Tax=Embleya sp. MST-111070 TaxID=3398231 RepID=UPI003F734378